MNKYPQFIMGVLPRPKMVTNNFGNRNFMQSWEGSTPIHFIFLLSFGGGGCGGRRRIFFQFFCSQHVPLKLPLGSQGCSQQHLALISYVLPKVLPFSPIQVGQRGRHSIFPQDLLFWEASMVSTFFFVMDQSSWLITKKKEVGLVRHPQLINMEQNTCVSTLIVCTYKGVCGRDVIMSLLRSCIFLLANFHILVT